MAALYFSILDLAKWDAALYTEKLLKRSSLEQMWTPVKLERWQAQFRSLRIWLGHHRRSRPSSDLVIRDPGKGLSARFPATWTTS